MENSPPFKDPEYLTENSHAPKFNLQAWDQLTEKDVEEIHKFTKNLSNQRKDQNAWKNNLKNNIESTIKTGINEQLFLREKKELKDLKPSLENLSQFPTISRNDLANEPWMFIPKDVDFSSMVLYNTAGTTGTPISVPSHPVAIAKYCSFIKEVLTQYGIEAEFKDNELGIALIGYQKETVTFPTKFNVLNDSGFVKIDLNKEHWNSEFDPCYYLSDLKPLILTGDPFAFSKLAELYEKASAIDKNLEILRPLAVIPTAIALKPAIKEYLTKSFQCPVIDWYSLTETGPLGYVCKENSGYHLLPTDIYLEILDKNENPVAEGISGEITVSGGRNPYFPLIRYKTGDFGKLISTPCPCGDPMPRIIDLQGRNPVFFKTSDMSINNADIVMVMYNYPVADFEFIQHKDLSCELRFCMVSGKDPNDYIEAITLKLENLLGPKIPLVVKIDPTLLTEPRDRKHMAFVSEVPFYYD
jgi:phenylacetate-coenzyme A ligase PaaK-like adenylate-forming protein